MNIRAKFVCNSVTKTVDAEQIAFSAAQGESNKQWSKWTPSGQLSMSITNPAVLGKFEPGKFYFLDFAPADE